MNPKIQTLWTNLEKQRTDLFAFLEKQDPSVLNRKPAENSWSVNQNILHLIEAEKASLAYMKKKLSFGTHVPKAGIKSTLRWVSLRLAFMLPFKKYKAPENLSNLPDDLNFEVLKQNWAAVRGDYQTFLSDLPPNLVTAELWRHQVAGKMSLTQMLDFFADHVNRHRRQMMRALEK